MCRRLVYLVLLLCVFGLSVARAERVEWTRAAYWDARYGTGWADEGLSVYYRDGLAAAGYEILNADQLKVWMLDRIADGKDSVVVFCRDIFPDTVADTVNQDSVVSRYLQAGGKIVFYADIPFYNQANIGGVNTNWANNGAPYVLGFNTSPTTGGVARNRNQMVTLTPEGLSWGLTRTWLSNRPASPTGTANMTILATDNAGSAAAWVQHFVAGDTFRGFVRIWDVDVTLTTYPPLEDIIRVAEYAGPKASNPEPADGQGWDMELLKWTGLTGMSEQRVYVGTDRAAVAAADTGSPEYKGKKTPTQAFYLAPAPWEPGMTHYWRIDVVVGSTVYTGDVWSFATTPSATSAPQPADGATYVASDAVLQWTAGAGAFSHDVYFGTDRAAVEAGAPETKKATGQVETTYTPAGLMPGTTYYWRVDEVAGDVPVPGEVWSFTVQPVLAKTDPALIGWWKLEDEKSGTVVDYSGWDHHGRLVGGPQWVEGYFGDAMKFDGVDDYVDLGTPSDWPAGAAPRSMCLWTKTAHLGATWRMAAAYGSAGTGLAMFIAQNGVDLWGGGYGDDISKTGFWEIDVWRHLCLTYDGTTARLYADGVEVAFAAKTWNLTLGRAHIGRQVNDLTEFWSGEVDDVRLYNVALTPEQVAAIMEGDPLIASDPQPARDATVDIRSATQLGWSPGATAAMHDVYFGADREAVKQAGIGAPEYMGRQPATTFSLAGKAAFGGGDYFWRVDEVGTGGATIYKGDVWKFTIPGSLIVDTFQTYTEDYVNVGCIYQTWVDGIGFTNPMEVAGNGTGAAVGHPTWDDTSPHYNKTTTETLVTIAGSSRSMPLYYDNSEPAKKYYSETVRTWTAPQDLTAAGVTDLSLWFKGKAPTLMAKPDGTYTISSTSGDISGTATDHFRFVYKRLDGDGYMSVKVNQLNATAPWSKAGVMIRETLEQASPRAHTIATGRRRWAFENRTTIAGASASVYSAEYAYNFPIWVKLERKGTQFTGSYSTDGANWTPISNANGGGPAANFSPNPQTIAMGNSVYIGFCVASNHVRIPAIAEFSDVTVTGSVSGDWTVADIGAVGSTNPANGPADLYVALQDASGTVGVATWPYGSTMTDLTQWRIPLSQFGVNASAVTKMFIGLGNRNSPQPDGTGLIWVDDITVVPPQP